MIMRDAKVRTCFGLLLVLLLPAGLRAQATPAADRTATLAAEDGIKVSRKDVLFGNPKLSTKPAELDYTKALQATPEARKIRDEGIEKGSAEYTMLKAKAVERLSKLIKATAVQDGHDCVVKKGSIRSKPDDLDVTDLTDQIVAELESTS